MLNSLIHLFLLLLPVLLSSCTYENNTILLFPGLDTASKKTIDKSSLYSGNITNLAMNEDDRSTFNRFLERTASFQKTFWYSSKHNHSYLVVLRPAYHNHSIKRVCRSAEIFLQDKNIKNRLFITNCRKKNGQWQLLE